MSDESTPFHNPFGALRALKERLPAEPEKPAPAPAATPSAPRTDSSSKTGRTYPRAVVRMERTGRGGKEVTVIEHLDLTSSDREKWLKALKASLGCGGVVEGANIVLQGDHRKRLPAILSERGVKRVTTG